MVLGYHDAEICGYIYREIYISTLFGILLGYPVGTGLATLVFRTIGFGAVENEMCIRDRSSPFVIFLQTNYPSWRMYLLYFLHAHQYLLLNQK